MGRNGRGKIQREKTVNICFVIIVILYLKKKCGWVGRGFLELVSGTSAPRV